MTVYVAAMPPQLRGRMGGRSRLYAFPTVPELPVADEFVILDSGAYGLSKQGRKIEKKHMEKLAAHYVEYGAGNDVPVVGIAPDAYPFPRLTMKNWAYWHEQGYPPVAPVIQFEHGRVDWLAIQKQAKFYAKWQTPFVCVSNPGLRGIVAKKRGMARAIAEVRRIMKPWWVHVLGAGWDVEDARMWASIEGVDSFDSVAYYTAAQDGEVWGERGEHWTDTAVFNLEAAQRRMGRIE